MPQEYTTEQLANPVVMAKELSPFPISHLCSILSHIRLGNNPQIRNLINRFGIGERLNLGGEHEESPLAYERATTAELLAAHILAGLDEPRQCRANVVIKRGEIISHALAGKPDVEGHYEEFSTFVEISVSKNMADAEYAKRLKGALEHMQQHRQKDGRPAYGFFLTNWSASGRNDALKACAGRLQQARALGMHLTPLSIGEFMQMAGDITGVPGKGPNRFTQEGLHAKLQALAEGMCKASREFEDFSRVKPLEYWGSVKKAPRITDEPTSPSGGPTHIPQPPEEGPGPGPSP